MKLKQNKSGFTLLEIIIVIIIVGVLASLALPRFFATVEFSKSAEALTSMGVLRQSMERCFVAIPDTYAGCNHDSSDDTPPASNLDVEDPANSPGARFDYLVSGQGAAGYVITATRNSADGGDGSSTIVLTQTAGGVTRSGTGKFAGIH